MSYVPAVYTDSPIKNIERSLAPIPTSHQLHYSVQLVQHFGCLQKKLGEISDLFSCAWHLGIGILAVMHLSATLKELERNVYMPPI